MAQSAGLKLVKLAEDSGDSRLTALAHRVRHTQQQYDSVLEEYRDSQKALFEAVSAARQATVGEVDHANRAERALQPKIDAALGQNLEASNQLIEASREYLARRMAEGSDTLR